MLDGTGPGGPNGPGESWCVVAWIPDWRGLDAWSVSIGRWWAIDAATARALAVVVRYRLKRAGVRDLIVECWRVG